MRYIYALFFLWAIAHNLNPLLIPVLKEVCILSDFQSALVDSAFYIGYFAFALPAGAFIKSKGYKKPSPLDCTSSVWVQPSLAYLDLNKIMPWPCWVCL